MIPQDDPENVNADVVKLSQRAPLWAEKTVCRRSIREAILGWRDRQDKRRARARAAANAIHTIQDQTKAARSFLVLSGWALALAVLYGCVDKTGTAVMWMLCAPLLIANAEKAMDLKEAADIDLRKLKATASAQKMQAVA